MSSSTVFRCKSLNDDTTHYFKIPSNYEIVRLLSEHLNSVVLLGRDKLSSTDFLMSRIRNPSLTSLCERRSVDSLITTLTNANHLNVLNFLKPFCHPNLVNLRDSIIPPAYDPEDFQSIYLIFDSMESNFQTFLSTRSGQTISPTHIKYFFRQMVNGVDFIHKCGLIHANIRPHTMYINKNCDLKLFGFEHCGLNSHHNIFEDIGLNKYNAPEFLFASPIFRGAAYTNKVDIWSLGMVLLEMILKEPVLYSSSNQDFLQRFTEVFGIPTFEDLKYPGFPEDSDLYSRELFVFREPIDIKKVLQELIPQSFADRETVIDLLSKMLVFKPSDRISAEEILSHPYFIDPEVPDLPVFTKSPGQSYSPIKFRVYLNIKRMDLLHEVVFDLFSLTNIQEFDERRNVGLEEID